MTDPRQLFDEHAGSLSFMVLAQSASNNSPNIFLVFQIFSNAPVPSSKARASKLTPEQIQANIKASMERKAKTGGEQATGSKKKQPVKAECKTPAKQVQ
jgi:hypothetical protein